MNKKTLFLAGLIGIGWYLLYKKYSRPLDTLTVSTEPVPVRIIDDFNSATIHAPESTEKKHIYTFHKAYDSISGVLVHEPRVIESSTVVEYVFKDVRINDTSVEGTYHVHVPYSFTMNKTVQKAVAWWNISIIWLPYTNDNKKIYLACKINHVPSIDVTPVKKATHVSTNRKMAAPGVFSTPMRNLKLGEIHVFTSVSYNQVYNNMYYLKRQYKGERNYSIKKLAASTFKVTRTK